MVFAEFFDALTTELQAFIEGVFRFEGPADRLRRDLRSLFGRGDMEPAQFLRLSHQLARGHYIEGELRVLQRAARVRRTELPPDGAHSLSRSLELVYVNRARLCEARSAMQQALQVLEREQAWLKHQAEDFYELAQRALPDENAARSALAIRQQCLEQAAGLAARMAQLQHELRAIDQLEARLRYSESSLLALHAQELLAGVELSINQRLPGK